MKSPPAANLDQRFCIQVRGQSFGEKSLALEAVPHRPQDQLSRKTHCSLRSSCLTPATGVSWVWLQRTFEEWDQGCGHVPGTGRLWWGLHHGHFPLVASDPFPVKREVWTIGSSFRLLPDPQLWPCAVRILILEVRLSVAPGSQLSPNLSCHVPLPLPDFRVRWAGCVGCAFHQAWVCILYLPLPAR